MNVRYRVTLTQYERNELGALLGGGKHPARKLKRAQILLAADAGVSDEDIAASVGVGGSTVYRTKRRFVEGNVERAPGTRLFAQRQTKEAGTDMFEPKATAPHLDSTATTAFDALLRTSTPLRSQRRRRRGRFSRATRNVDNSQVCRADRDPPSWLHDWNTTTLDCAQVRHELW